MLQLPVCKNTKFILIGPHYPENVGAAARAIKTMGLTRLCIVAPGRLASPTSEMASKMAVKSWDVLEAAEVCETVGEAVRGCQLVIATTARRGQKRLLAPNEAASVAATAASRGQHTALLFGNEKTGLTTEQLAHSSERVRIPMAADQPSINLAQSCQIFAYEWFCEGLRRRRGEGGPPST